MTPYIVRLDNGNEVPVPCGKCPACYVRRASQWSFRLMQEEKRSTSAHFITLTYDTSNVFITPKGYMGISVRDCQLFIKRLRRLHDRSGNGLSVPGRSIRYYMVGEYGKTFDRPHYHAIIFNADIKLIQPAWQLGSVFYGSVTEASIGYCTKYMSKVSKFPLHENDDRIKEFGLFSKGLGSNYLTRQMEQWHKVDINNRMYCNLTDGRKIAMPRYLKDKLYTPEERAEAGIITRKKMILELEKQMEDKNFQWNKEQGVFAAFRQMKQNFYKNRKL